MADVFDIDSGGHMDYHSHRNDIDNYNRHGHGGWTPVEQNTSHKDPRLDSRNRRDSRNNSSLERTPIQLYDKLGVPISPSRKRYSRSPSPRRHGHHRRSSERSNESPSGRPVERDHDGWHSPQRMQQNHQQQQQMYSQPPLPPPQSYQQAPPPPIYQQHEQYNANAYQQQVPYQQNYNQVPYGQPQQSNFNQYSPAGYPQQQQQSYSGHSQPGPPGDEYSGSWAPVSTSYPNMSQPPPPVARPPAPQPPASHMVDQKKDNLKKEAAIANEMKQQQATLIKQRDEYLRKTTVLRRELDKLRLQKHELLAEKSPPRDSDRILRENAKLQLEIQNKLKSINNVVDMLSGIIGDGLQMKEEDVKSIGSDSPKRAYKLDQLNRKNSVDEDELLMKRSFDRTDSDIPNFNYVHYDPELHWCRVCDVFPRSAKDLLNHLHSAEHRQVTQEHQLVDTPWHKLPTDEELPSFKGAPVKRVPIKGLQFFISATAWYCKLCDTWIGDLHCASVHLKSKNHSHNYSNFVEQNPHWEINWIKDREKAFERCGKLKLHSDEEVPPAPEPPQINDKNKSKKRSKYDSFLDSSKEKKRRKKSKKRKKVESSGSSSSSTSSDSSSEEDSDKSKSIRVAMRNKMRLQAQMILKEEMEGKLEALGRLVEEDKLRRQKEQEEKNKQKTDEQAKIEDNIINQWMTVSNPNTNHDKHILEGLKGRLKQRQEANKERAEQMAAEQRKREREREERELKEMKEREQREIEERMKQEREREERDREERERIKDRERSRRKHRSESSSPERYRGRSRSKSSDRRTGRSHGPMSRNQDRQYRKNDKRSDRYSPEPDKYRFKRPNSEEDRSSYESHFEKQAAESAKSSKEKKPVQIGPRKLPFIGRMPLFKKKGGETEEKEIKKEEYDIRQTKFEAVSSARAFIPAPGVVHITKLATPPDPVQMIKINAENPPPPPQIIPEPPQISENEEAPPPPIITPTTVEVDMDDGEVPPLPPGVPGVDSKPLTKPAGEHLPRDFQEALNIIFPGDQRPEHMQMAQDPNLMMQYQYGMGYGMMYPGMQMYDYSQDRMVSEGPDLPPPEIKLPDREPPPPASNDDDLAMLGIDAEDMAAQTI